MLLELKKEILINKINSQHGLEECTIIGKPSDLIKTKTEQGGAKLQIILDELSIPYETKRTGFITVNGAFLKDDLLAIAVEYPSEEQVLLIMQELFSDIQELYEVIIPSSILEMIFGWNEDCHMELADAVFRMIPVSQAELARQTGRSKQSFSEIKAKRMKPTLELISQLMNLYPLLPWDYLIMTESAKTEFQ